MGVKKASSLKYNYYLLLGAILFLIFNLFLFKIENTITINFIVCLAVDAWLIFGGLHNREIQFDDQRITVVSVWGQTSDYSMDEVVGFRRLLKPHYRIRVWDNGRIRSFYFTALNGSPPPVEELETIVKAKEAENRKRLGLD